MLIRIALWMIVLCLPVFLLAKALFVFTFVVFATIATKFAALLLLLAFGLLFFGGLLNVIKHVFQFFLHYFSEAQREQRQFIFVKNQQVNRQRLFYFQRLQLNYFKERQQQRLLKKNNQQQIKSLSDSIEQELQHVKHILSKDYFSQLQHENRRYRLQQNEQALLELHQKISTLTGK